MAFAFKFSMIGVAAPLVLCAQINVTGVSTTTTQAVLQYISPVASACSLEVADMNRAITIASAAQSSGQVEIQTAAPHGLLTGAVIYIENSGVTAWNGWQVVTSVPASSTLTFASTTLGSATQGNIGVLVDDVNPALFPGANQDSRPGNVTTGQTETESHTQFFTQPAGRSRTFVIGLRYAQFASDGNRHSRALQLNSRHHYTLTCGSQSFDREFQTQNIPLGDTHNEGPLADRNNPGQYAYPTIQWSNQSQALIDPISGLRSFRSTSPQGTASQTQTFVTAIDLQSAWQNATAPLSNTGGAAMFTGPCPSGTCPLLLRADNLILPGGASYENGGNSLDWFTVTVNQASIGNPACAGDDCKIVACLTVNGVTCASGNEEASLTGTPANYTFGTQNLIDLWQGSGAPNISRIDASQATGIVNYNAATKQVTLVNGYGVYPFNIKWTAGSAITIAGGQYTIASVQSEIQLTLASGPNSNLTGVTYSANNFGVLLWKKTAAADRVSLGYTTYLYGSTAFPAWTAAATDSCSPPVSVGGVQGYNCFAGQELYWVAADGSDVRDLGFVGLSYEPDGKWSDAYPCGISTSGYQFDPQDGNTWYCTAFLYFDQARLTIVQAHYNGDHSRYTPGQVLPDCLLNNNVQPCVRFTVMQPNKSDSVTQAALAFSPAYAASGFTNCCFMAGISPDGDIGFAAGGASQDSPTWMFIFTLGDRTPSGTDANSVRIIAGASTYAKAPLSWCSDHDMLAPSAGWVEVISNDLTIQGAAGTFNMTLTSAPLNRTAGAPGGLNTCPPNPFGVTGQVCTPITVNGEPVRASDGGFLQNAQVGDLMYLDGEEVRVLVVNSATSMTIQRGDVGTQIASHTNTTFVMGCGTRNSLSTAWGLWNYRSDPYGTNANWNTVVADITGLGGHTYIGGGIPGPQATVAAGGAPYNLGALCPPSQGGSCDQVRMGYMSTAQQSQPYAIAINPPFAGISGIGVPNQVDTHPGPCFIGWCMDARPMEGGPGGAVGQPNQPFTQVTGQLWKFSGAQSILNRKFLSTMAYVGRSSLVDVSGPASVLGGGASDSYKYCYALQAGECQPGSAAGSIYVNAPYVSYPYCVYPGIAVQDDDTNSICIGDLGAYTGNLAQVGYAKQDLVGAAIRRLGPNYSRWNQQDVFWNSDATPNGLLLMDQVRWLDGIRSDDLAMVLPPFPNPDGVARYTYLSVPVAIDPPSGLGAQSAIVEFGYAENGNPESYYCTSRQETCVAASSAINQSTPFYYEQSETYSGVPCATGCTVMVPALSQRVLYYRWKYLGSSGEVVSASQVHVAITP